MSQSCPVLIAMYVLSRDREKPLLSLGPIRGVAYSVLAAPLWEKVGEWERYQGNRKSKQKGVLWEEAHGMEGFGIFSPLSSNSSR